MTAYEEYMKMLKIVKTYGYEYEVKEKETRILIYVKCTYGMRNVYSIKKDDSFTKKG